MVRAHHRRVRLHCCHNFIVAAIFARSSSGSSIWYWETASNNATRVGHHRNNYFNRRELDDSSAAQAHSIGHSTVQRGRKSGDKDAVAVVRTDFGKDFRSIFSHPESAHECLSFSSILLDVRVPGNNHIVVAVLFRVDWECGVFDHWKHHECWVRKEWGDEGDALVQRSGNALVHAIRDRLPAYCHRWLGSNLVLHTVNIFCVCTFFQNRLYYQKCPKNILIFTETRVSLSRP